MWRGWYWRYSIHCLKLLCCTNVTWCIFISNPFCFILSAYMNDSKELPGKILILNRQGIYDCSTRWKSASDNFHTDIVKKGGQLREAGGWENEGGGGENKDLAVLVHITVHMYICGDFTIYTWINLYKTSLTIMCHCQVQQHLSTYSVTRKIQHQ